MWFVGSTMPGGHRLKFLCLQQAVLEKMVVTVGMAAISCGQ
jgi:hypothetical protein